MLRVLLLVALVATVTIASFAVGSTVGPAVGRTTERDAPFVEAISPRLAPLAMTIL